MTTGNRCGYTVIDGDGIEQPCDRPATGWRWYQDCEHEDALDVACIFHANEGGRRLAAAEPLREFAEHVAKLGDPDDPDVLEKRRRVTLGELIAHARRALDGGATA